MKYNPEEETIIYCPKCYNIRKFFYVNTSRSVYKQVYKDDGDGIAYIYAHERYENNDGRAYCIDELRVDCNTCKQLFAVSDEEVRDIIESILR